MNTYLKNGPLAKNLKLESEDSEDSSSEEETPKTSLQNGIKATNKKPESSSEDSSSEEEAPKPTAKAQSIKNEVKKGKLRIFVLLNSWFL